MPTDRNRFVDAAVFCLLVAIGVAGRWGQPEYCVTPIAAVALFAGYYFGRVGIALLVPLFAMAISDLVLPNYQYLAVHVAVYGAMAAPALLGRLMRRPLASRLAGVARLATCAALPALMFFFATNTTLWLVGSLYEKTPAGLAQCYAAAIPFIRQMAAGDLTYTALLFGAALAVGAFSLTGLPTNAGVPAKQTVR